jgi:hypothetical protein
MRKEVQNAIDVIKGLDLSKYPYYDIITQVANIGMIGHLGVDLHPGKYIYRARLNENEEHFYSKCQLTYKPQQYNKTCQRASTPNMSMFYGSILPEEFEKEDLDEVRVVPTFEAIPWLRDKTSKGVKHITYTKWIVTQDIKLIAILQHGNFYDKSSYTRKLMDDYEVSLNQIPNHKDETVAFMTFMASEFAKEVDGSNDYNYLISAAFSEILVKKGYDGVLYPSVRLEGKGFNVALTPQAADIKLQLEVVMECTAYKLFEKTVLDNDLQAILYPNQSHFEFQKVDPEYHAGELNCLNELGLDSIDKLK